MRHLLTVALALAGCSFYQPDLTDCVLPCGDGAACPGGMTCVEGLCRAAGHTAACQCTAGKTRPCGSNVGACKQGFQECTRDGVWGECTGSIGPTEEVCDGRDNDCDGLTDYTAATLLIEDRTPFTSYATRLFGHVGGYALYYHGGFADGGEGVLVQRYDNRFHALGQPTLIYAGDWDRSYAAANESSVVVVVAVGDRVLAYATTMTPGAPGVTVLDVPDSGYKTRSHVSMLPDGGARVAWCTRDTLRLADVPLAGGAPSFRDYPVDVDGGAIIDYNQSSSGRYGLVQVNSNSDGGYYLNFFVDLDSLDAGRAGIYGYDYPFAPQGRSWLQEVGGRIPYVSAWDDEVGDRRVTYTYDLLESDDNIDILPPGIGRWGDSATTLMPDGDLLFAISDLKQQSIVLAKIHGSSFDDYETVLRNLPENSGFGTPRVAMSDDEMVGLAWMTTRGVYARRVCPPYVGD